MGQISPQELQMLVQRVIASGELGRSRTYSAILHYLMECAIRSEKPKELAIAVEVLGRDSDFDVGKDSIVRVHIHHLRNKLATYFRKKGQQEPWRLEIPKGQYILTAVPNTADAASPQAAPAVGAEATEGAGGRGRRFVATWVLTALVLVLALTTTFSLWQLRQQDTGHALADQAPWANMLDDQVPILIVVGDYFIMGEVDDQGNVARLVRDFNINSEKELENRYLLDPSLYERYYNLDLSYLPNGAAFALMQLMPLFTGEEQRISMKLQSRLTAGDLTTHHILYVGYISGLGLLEDRVFASSGLRVGENYDELLGEENKRYTSNSVLRLGAESFHDYGLISNFRSPRGNQFVVVAGMRDAGLISVAQQMGRWESFAQLHAALVDNDIGGENWEALYEVFGMDHTNFDAELVYTGELDSRRIWGGEM